MGDLMPVLQVLILKVMDNHKCHEYGSSFEFLWTNSCSWLLCCPYVSRHVCVKQKCVLLGTNNVIQIVFNLKNIHEFVELFNWTHIFVTFLTGNDLRNEIVALTWSHETQWIGACEHHPLTFTPELLAYDQILCIHFPDKHSYIFPFNYPPLSFLVLIYCFSCF